MCSSQFICAVWMRYCIRNKYLVDQNGAISIWVGNIKVVGGFHLELVHGLAGVGVHDAVTLTGIRHIDSSPSSFEDTSSRLSSISLPNLRKLYGEENL